MIQTILLDIKQQRRWVEITFVAHSHPNFTETMDNDVIPDSDIVQDIVKNKGSGMKKSVKSLKDLIHLNGGPTVLNYRFLREFTKGIDPSTTNWSISAINHFKINEPNL